MKELLVKAVRLRELLGLSELNNSGKLFPSLGLEGQESQGGLEPWQSLPRCPSSDGAVTKLATKPKVGKKWNECPPPYLLGEAGRQGLT